MKTELEKRASKFIDETDTMQFTTMELLTMFAEKEQALQLLQANVVGQSEQLCDCKCEYPIIRTGVTEYCSICQLEVK